MKRLLKYTLAALAAILVLPTAFLCGLYLTADMEQPAVTIDTAAYRVTDHGGYAVCHGSFLRRNPHGLWELYTAGSPEESGAAAGALTAGLMHYQEQVFVDRIREFIPSEGYLKFLGGMIRIFNRNLGRHVPEEYRREIYARSLYCSHDFDAIGTPYERQLNYHAAHDIGHAMSQYMLVGCSSFAAWGGASDDGKPVVGRNFDFYMGDDFTRNKIVTFCRPQAGHPFASIGWAGMIGVLSGMNSEGLTVTINAAKGPVPLASATPISILAREILQHAATIAEALEIARRRDTFVSESLLVASARDGRAAIIEKTPRRTVLYEGDGEYLICTNHYQSEAFADDGDNRENIAMTDSPHRFARLEELMAANAPLDVPAAAAMLRDTDFSYNTLGAKITELWPELELFSTYASTEMQTSITECGHHCGGHVPADMLLVELLDEQNNPVPEGQEGEVVITTLGVRGMPLLRFKTGDICIARTGRCACGRTTMRLSSVIGRRGQMIKFKGTTLYPPALYDVLENIPGVNNYIIEVFTGSLGTDQIVLRIGSTRRDEAFEKEIKDTFRSKVRVAPEVVFEQVEYIAKKQMPQMSRKQIKFVDLREQTK